MKYLIVLFAIVLLSACSSGSQEPSSPVFVNDGFALDGYDPVAYFEQAEPKKGSENEVVEYNGFVYCFSSSKNKQLFEADPDKYLPAYGGWCAYAVAENATRMSPDPTQWQIQDGKLQLFYDDWYTSIFGNLKETWNEDSTSYRQKADTNWDTMN